MSRASPGAADRPQFHVAPRDGWLNDPNAPLYWKGRWHMCVVQPDRQAVAVSSAAAVAAPAATAQLPCISRPLCPQVLPTCRGGLRVAVGPGVGARSQRGLGDLEAPPAGAAPFASRG